MSCFENRVSCPKEGDSHALQQVSSRKEDESHWAERASSKADAWSQMVKLDAGTRAREVAWIERSPCDKDGGSHFANIESGGMGNDAQTAEVVAMAGSRASDGQNHQVEPKAPIRPYN